jgi:hypothetical protein
MTTLIDNPQNILKTVLAKLVEMIETGGQIGIVGLQKRIMNAELIAICFDRNVIVATATLKHPSRSYKDGVFKAAGVKYLAREFDRELGYIVTAPGFEGKKLLPKSLKGIYARDMQV